MGHRFKKELTMKKNNFIYLVLLLCGLAAVQLPAQGRNVIITDEKKDTPMAIGYCTRELFSDTSFSSWFDTEYEEYALDTVTLDSIGQLPEDLGIIIVMGTWCSDSRMQVPRLYKILDHLNFPQDNITLIAVDREKKGQEGEVTDLNIELVPTIIITQGDDEIGRIIESPQETLEKDLLNILRE
jgi:hypothetical protein